MKVEIPIEILELDEDSFHPVVKAVVNETPCTLIIDTGASRSVFDLNTFEVIYLEKEKGKEIIPAGIIEGNIENRSGIISRFMIGELKVKNLKAVFINLEHINRLYGQIEGAPHISGLLGSDFLVRFKAFIDFKKSILRLSK